MLFDANLQKMLRISRSTTTLSSSLRAAAAMTCAARESKTRRSAPVSNSTCATETSSPARHRQPVQAPDVGGRRDPSARHFQRELRAAFRRGQPGARGGVRINVIRVVSYVEHEQLDLRPGSATSDDRPKPRTHRPCHLPGADEPVQTAVYDHSAVAEA